jgi:hypothetical protein
MPEQDGSETGCNEPVQTRFSRKKLCILLVVALLILTVLVFYVSIRWHTPDLNELLTRAKLARLPESIENLRVETRPDIEDGPDYRILFVQFQAEPDDITDFIANSHSVDKNRSHPLRPIDDRQQVPPWYLTDQSISGRSYHFRGKDMEGAVAVNDNSNTVYVAAYYLVNPRLRDTKIFMEDLKDDVEDFADDLIHEVADIFWD